MPLPNDWHAALAAAAHLESTPSDITRMSKQFGEDVARWAIGQWELRRRAAGKHPRAFDMLWDRDGLEMATHHQVAAYHASLFQKPRWHGHLAPSETLNRPIYDLTAGLGLDSLALSEIASVIALETDRDRAELLSHNLNVLGMSAEILVASGLDLDLKGQWAFADPARRTGRTRHQDPNAFSPPLDLLFGKLEECEFAVLKLSPMLPDAVFQRPGWAVEFVSFGGECREAVMLWNSGQNDWTAVHLESGERREGSPQFAGGAQDDLQEFFFEADPALIRSHAVLGLSEQMQLELLGDSNGYLTGDSKHSCVWLKSYRVLSEVPADVKKLRAMCRTNGWKPEVIKSRSKRASVEVWSKALKGLSGEPVSVAFWDSGRSVKAAVLEKL